MRRVNKNIEICKVLINEMNDCLPFYLFNFLKNSALFELDKSKKVYKKKAT